MYGKWDSIISAQNIAATGVSIADVLVDASTGRVFHLESRPAENGRVVVVDDAGKEITPKEHNVRDDVHEYGGAAAIVAGGVVYYSHLKGPDGKRDGRVYSVSVDGGEAKPITPFNPVHRFANFSVYPNSSPPVLVCILEDHTHDEPSTEVVNTLVLIHTETGQVQPFVSGADFYCSPSFSPDGKQFTWIEWYLPDMPWEGSLLHVADVSSSFELSNKRQVAGEKGSIAVLYPSWTPNSSKVVYLCDVARGDASRYLNPYIYDTSSGTSKPLLSEPLSEDFSECFECFAGSPYTILSDTDGVFSSHKNGRSILYYISLKDCKHTELDSRYVSVDFIHTTGTDSIAFMGATIEAKGTIVKASNVLQKPAFTEHPPPSFDTAWKFPKEYVSQPQPMSLEISGLPVHVLYFPPCNPNHPDGSEGDARPPCVVSSHGGPTGCATQDLLPLRGFFTSRGWAWLDVNYSGSSAYGRDYRERLRGNWGVLDIMDVVNAAKTISSAPHNLVDSKKMVVRGGSAGGYTTLSALSTLENEHDLTVFAAGTSLYGISNLLYLAKGGTHKFESQYMFKLLGGSPDQPGMEDVYTKRSPVYHGDRIKSPLLLLQGADDNVVPKQQSIDIKNAIEKNGGQVKYKEFAGEGHGWRMEQTMIDALNAEEAAYREWVIDV